MCSTPGLRQPNAASQTMNDVEVKEVSLLGTLWASSGEEGWRKITNPWLLTTWKKAMTHGLELPRD